MRGRSQTLIVLLSLAVMACTDTPTLQRTTAVQPVDGALAAPRNEVIPGRWIVLLDAPERGAGRAALVSRVAEETGVQARRDLAALAGFAGDLSDAQVAALRRDPRVRYVEQDRRIQLATTQSLPAAGQWGLDRIDQLSLPLTATYTYTRTGAGVNAYVIDSGIFLTHFEFATRWVAAFDAHRSPSDSAYATDCNGHGTHVAGILGGTTYGVAKEVTLHAVRVSECTSYVALSDLLLGIDWVIDNHAPPAVANISISGAESAVLDDAVQQLVAAGVFTTVAAGNGAEDACDTSPAGAHDAYAVAASTVTDSIAGYSNFGACVDAYGPGDEIRSAYVHPLYPNNRGWAQELSGTSMAAPHVAGTAALLLEDWPTLSPADVTTWLNGNAAVNKITNNPTGTPNRLVNKRWL